MTKRQRLYYLIEGLFLKQYDVKTFCEEFEAIFYPDSPSEELTADELRIFETLGNIVVRFSPYPDDLENYPGIYKSATDIENAVNVAYNQLVPIKNHLQE